MSLISPDRRPSCNRTTASLPLLFLGTCYNQHNNDFVGIPALTNVTAVPDYAIATTGSPIDPYPRGAAASAPACSDWDTCNTTCDSSSCLAGCCGQVLPGNPFCEIPGAHEILTCGTNTQSFSIGKYHNCYISSSTETRSYDNCRNIGYKNVAARKSWVGRKSYCTRELGLPDTFDWCYEDACTQTHGEDTTPDLTKYLGMNGSFVWDRSVEFYEVTRDDFTCCFTSVYLGTSASHAEAASTTHIDKFANFYVDSCTSSSYGDAETDDERADWAFEQLVGGGVSITQYSVNGDQGDLLAFYSSNLLPLRTPSTITGGGNAWHVEYSTNYYCVNACTAAVTSIDYVDVIVDIDLDAGTARVQEFSYMKKLNGCDCDPELKTIRDDIMTISCTNYNLSSLSFYRSESLSEQGTDTWEVDGNLTTTYTSAEATAEIPVLLNYWDMSNNAIYPWRYEFTNIMPLVCYDEGVGAPSIGSCEDLILYTGEIKGIPAPTGMDRVWIPDYPNYAICTDTCNSCDPPIDGKCLYIKDYGAWSDELGVPHGTFFTNHREAANLPAGACCMSNMAYSIKNQCELNCSGDVDAPLRDDIIWGVKYAEIIFPKQSYKFARPCEIDRFQISESTNRCVTGSYNNVLVLEETGTANTAISSGSFVWVCGVTNIEDGLYKASAASNYEITLGPNYISASILPDVPVQDCGTGLVYALRWQTLKPAICGLISLTSISSGSNNTFLTCSLSEPTYLVNEDEIIISGSKGANDYLDNTWKIYVIDNQTIILSGSNGEGLSAYTSSTGTVKSYNSADYKWDDVGTKGDYVSIQWNTNYRDVGEYLRITESVAYAEAQVDCDLNPCPAPTVPSEPRPYQTICGMEQEVNSFSYDQFCLPLNTCSPAVAYYSPNSESFTKVSSSINSSYNHGFVIVDIDSQYGSRWSGVFKQSMADPLFVTPPCICNNDVDPAVYNCDPCNWIEDNGTCQEDDLLSDPCIKYYPMRAYFEARNSVPSGSPALPDGLTLEAMPLSEMTSSVCNSNGKGIYPMPTIDAPSILDRNEDGYVQVSAYPYLTPWYDYESKLYCVCNDGRFTNQYMDNGIICDFSSSVVLPPP